METAAPAPGPTILEEVEAYYWDGGLPVMGGLSGVIVLCLMCACCLGCSISKDVSLVDKYKQQAPSIGSRLGDAPLCTGVLPLVQLSSSVFCDFYSSSVKSVAKREHFLSRLSCR